MLKIKSSHQEHCSASPWHSVEVQACEHARPTEHLVGEKSSCPAESHGNLQQ